MNGRLDVLFLNKKTHTSNNRPTYTFLIVMIDLDIVFPYVGRSYRTSWETVVGSTVSGDPQWCVPISLHYHYGLLDAATASRYVARVVVSSRPPKRTTECSLEPLSFTPTLLTRLVYAPSDNSASPECHQAPTIYAPTSDTPSTPPITPSTPSVEPVVDVVEVQPRPNNTPGVVVLDEHYDVLEEAIRSSELAIPEASTDPGWRLVDVSPCSSRSLSPRSLSESPRDTEESTISQDHEDGVSDAIVLPSLAARVAVPTVSVVMTTYNCVKYLEHAVRSLQSQTLTNWELIIVDDRSTDGTDTQLRALAEEDDRIVYLHNRYNVGCYAAKNTAIAYARGEWLTFHDADDHSMSERLEKQLWYCVKGEIERRGRARAQGAHPPKSSSDEGYDACYVTSLSRKQKVWTWLPITLFLPLQLFREKLGAYDTVRFGADSELRKRLHSLRLRVGILKDYLYACPDRWIELSTRTTSLTGDPTKDPIRELYAQGYAGLHLSLQQAPTLTEVDARLLRYPFPPFKRQDVCTRTHPFVIPGLTEAQADRLFPSTEAIRENLMLNRSGEPPPPW